MNRVNRFYDNGTRINGQKKPTAKYLKDNNQKKDDLYYFYGQNDNNNQPFKAFGNNVNLDHDNNIKYIAKKRNHDINIEDEFIQDQDIINIKRNNYHHMCSPEKDIIGQNIKYNNDFKGMYKDKYKTMVYKNNDANILNQNKINNNTKNANILYKKNSDNKINNDNSKIHTKYYSPNNSKINQKTQKK